MGPITGIRIVNLRVRDKVAYPDVTLDLVGAKPDHLVVGLENGGGKSTLLGAVYHVFVPGIDEFLPRRAQRRQGKQGEPKRLEDYVPGGDPTHFIVEVESPTVEGTLPLLDSARLLVGACLWKPAGAPSSTRASETFWSARGVGPNLSLRAMDVRGPGGRLLDHAEFNARLRHLRTDIPAAQITIEDGKAAWQAHLRDLGIDVDYVRQFLLRMNEDEGAADRVFTYASSRAFLNSLVGVVGDPAAITQLKERLVETSDDAATVLVDRKRVRLLEGLVKHTGPLSETMASLDAQLAERSLYLSGLAATRHRATQHLAHAHAAAADLAVRKSAQETKVTDARSAYNETNARYVQSKLQVATLEVEAAAKRVAGAETARSDARIHERTAIAGALLADRRTAESRIRELDDLLAQRTLEAEPLRRALASGLLALEERLAADLHALECERFETEEAERRASSMYADALDKKSKAEVALGRLGVERALVDRDSTALRREIDAAVIDGILRSWDSDARAAAANARDGARVELRRADDLEIRRINRSQAVLEMQQRDATLAESLGRAAASFEAAEQDLANARLATRNLVDALTESGFIEVQPIILDHHADTTLDRLELALDGARKRQVGAAVGVAASERAATWLADHERLPPRVEVERLSASARAGRLGAHPGWNYLASLPIDVATRYALNHAGLADGIVVSVPEDLDAVVELVTEARHELGGPVVVGLPAAFEEAASVGPPVTVVLPHDAYWSREAGRELAVTRADEATRWRSDYSMATQLSDNALSLRQHVRSWIDEIGVGGIDRRSEECDRLVKAKDGIVTARHELAVKIGDASTARDEAERGRDEARQRAANALANADRLDALAAAQARLNDLETRRAEIEAEEAEATCSRTAADEQASQAERQRKACQVRISTANRTSGALDSQRADLCGLRAVVVHPGDVAREADRSGDRLLLAAQVQDREARWRGAITDPELRSQLQTLRTTVASIEKHLQGYADVVASAQARIVADPGRSADDFRREADEVRGEVERIGERIGELKATMAQLERAAEAIRDELRTLRRPAQLTAEERARDLPVAVEIRDRLLRSRDDAMRLRTEREGELAALTGEEERVIARVKALESVPQRLVVAQRGLARGTTLVPTVPVPDVLSDIDVEEIFASPNLPSVVATILSANDAALVFDADSAVMSSALDDVDLKVEEMHDVLSRLEDRASSALDAMEALLRGAEEDVVKNDRVIQMFRAAARPSLTALARNHHSDVLQRLDATRHHVETFDARLATLAETAYATIAALLREVRQTVRDSQLPNTPAMGRWAGAELLKLTGLDSLKVDERKVAIASSLRGWFDPEREDKSKSRRFDSDEVVFELLEAVSPQFSAKILIPSDPLDPEHMPVDLLARETSGGEGVAVALIMASLLASRRASMRGHRRTTLMLDNPFAKVTKPEFLRLARDVATELDVQLVMLTGIRDLAALAVFPKLTQLRVSRRQNANFVVPYVIEDDRLQPLLREGTLFVSPSERAAADKQNETNVWPTMSSVSVTRRSDGSGQGP